MSINNKHSEPNSNQNLNIDEQLNNQPNLDLQMDNNPFADPNLFQDLDEPEYEVEDPKIDLNTISKSFKRIQAAYEKYGSDAVNEASYYDELTKEKMGLADDIIFNNKNIEKALAYLKSKGYIFHYCIYNALNTIRKCSEDQDDFIKMINEKRLALDLLHFHGAVFNIDNWNAQMATKRVVFEELPQFVLDYENAIL